MMRVFATVSAVAVLGCRTAPPMPELQPAVPTATTPAPSAPPPPLVGAEGRDAWGGDRREPELRHLRTLLREGRFEELDRAFALCSDYAAADPVAYEHWGIDPVVQLASEREAGQLAARWIAAAPQSFAAANFSGWAAVHGAWRERGDGWPVPPGTPGFERVRHFARIAELELERSLSLRPTTAARLGLIRAAIAHAPRAEVERQLAAAVAAAPRSFALRREQTIYATHPKWGGSSAALAPILGAAGVGGNPRFALLPGLPPLETCRRRLAEGRLQAASASCEEAASHGAPWEVLALRADVALARADFDLALELLDRALVERPQRAVLHLRRARALFHTMRSREAAHALLSADESLQFASEELPHQDWTKDMVILGLTADSSELELEKARELVALAREIEPEAPETLLAVGRLALREGDRKAAKAAYRASLVADAKDEGKLAALEPLFEMLLDERSADEAAALIAAHRSARPTLPVLWFLEARAQAALGRPAEALDQARLACEALERRACALAEALAREPTKPRRKKVP